MVTDFDTTETVQKDSTKNNKPVEPQNDLPIVQHMTADKAGSVSERVNCRARRFSSENLQKENERIMQALALAQQHVNDLKHRLCIS